MFEVLHENVFGQRWIEYQQRRPERFECANETVLFVVFSVDSETSWLNVEKTDQFTELQEYFTSFGQECVSELFSVRFRISANEKTRFRSDHTALLPISIVSPQKNIGEKQKRN